jgi:ABC-type multidrug transport system fused ATPase/permease subunit
MVLDAGRVIEYGSPSELLAQAQGSFRQMVEKSHNRDMLLDLAERKR